MITAVVTVKQLIAGLKIPKDSGVGRIELRLDIDEGWREFLKDPRLFCVMMDQYEQPFLATCRRKKDRGSFKPREEIRLAVLKRASEFFPLVDLEWDIVPEIDPKKLLRSYHNFKFTYDSDIPLFCRSLSAFGGGEEIKLAFTAQRLIDNLHIRNFLREYRGHKVTAFCMGEYGVVSRILAPAWGSHSTYAVLEGPAVAPGMLTVDELSRIYRAHKLDEHSAVYGIAGAQVGHSLSPQLHNAAIEKSGINAVYVPLATPGGYDLADFAAKLPLKGASVTVPYKEEMIRWCKSFDASAEAVGAVNTLTIEAGKLRGANTDVKGFSTAIADEFGEVAPGCSFLVLGAGGSAKAVVASLLKQGAYVGVYARRHAQAKELCKGTAARPVVNLAAPKVKWDCVINCTPCGMRGESLDDMPIYWDELARTIYPSAVFHDLVYEPPLTPLLARAQAEGFHIANGLSMLLRQGEAQAAIWGYLPPRTRFEPPAPPARNLVWLIGYRASGKSKLAAMVARKQRIKLFDLDAMIEKRAERKIAEIFAESQAKFRVLEDVELSLLAARETRGIVATGGGVVLNERLIETMRATGKVIYLDAPDDLLVNRLKRSRAKRPSLTGKNVADEVAEVMRQRRPLYQKAAHVRIEISKESTPDALAEEIVSRM